MILLYDLAENEREIPHRENTQAPYKLVVKKQVTVVVYYVLGPIDVCGDWRSFGASGNTQPLCCEGESVGEVVN